MRENRMLTVVAAVATVLSAVAALPGNPAAGAEGEVTFVADAAVSRNIDAPWVTVPGSVVAGDRLVLVVSVGTADRTATTPSGWTAEASRSAGSSMRSWVWSRTATGSDAGSRVTIPLSGSAKASVQLAAYRGSASGALGVTSEASTTSATTRRTPAVPAATGDWVASVWTGKTGSAAAWTPEAGLVARGGTANTGSGRIVARLADPGSAVEGGTQPGRLAMADGITGSSVTWSIVVPAGAAVDSPPSASFTQQCAGLTCTFDGSSSGDAEGPVTGWAWTFGDGSSAAGETVTHTFPAAGDYTVGLTVTDTASATGTTSRTVVVGGGGPVQEVQATVETTPVGHTGDSADDPAIWVHPTDPSGSLVIGNDKQGALEVYDLGGTRIQRITTATSFWGNVDVRQGVTVGGVTRDVVAAYNGGIRPYTVDPNSRALQPIGDGTGTIPTNGGEGLCSYHATSGELYVFAVTRPGRVRQYLIHDSDGDGLLQGSLVREFQVGSEAEGCVADDEAGVLYVAEEDTGLWRYGAGPGAGATRSLMDTVGPGGHLAYDVEGVTMARTGMLSGYLLVSAQNGADPQRSYFAVYDRRTNAYLASFRVSGGPAADGCERTDGIAAHAGDLGAGFPAGLFVCQDNGNTTPAAGNQNFKLTPLDDILPVG